MCKCSPPPTLGKMQIQRSSSIAYFILWIIPFQDYSFSGFQHTLQQKNGSRHYKYKRNVQEEVLNLKQILFIISLPPCIHSSPSLYHETMRETNIIQFQQLYVLNQPMFVLCIIDQEAKGRITWRGPTSIGKHMGLCLHQQSI